MFGFMNNPNPRTEQPNMPALLKKISGQPINISSLRNVLIYGTCGCLFRYCEEAKSKSSGLDS